MCNVGKLLTQWEGLSSESFYLHLPKDSAQGHHLLNDVLACDHTGGMFLYFGGDQFFTQEQNRIESDSFDLVGIFALVPMGKTAF